MSGKINLGLSYGHYKWMAAKIGPNIEPEMVMAFSDVECKRTAFDSDGFPAILYERHVVYRNIEPKSLARQMATTYPSLIKSDGYGPGGYGSYASQRVKLSKAMSILGGQKDAALEGCSWGPWQELGENWEGLEFNSVGEFVDTMKSGLRGCAEIFIRSIKWRGLVTAMRNHDFVNLALKYNGKAALKWGYHTKLSIAYKENKRLKINWSTIVAEPPPTKKPDLIPWLGDLLPKVNMSNHNEAEFEPIIGLSSLDDIEDNITTRTLDFNESDNNGEPAEHNSNQSISGTQPQAVGGDTQVGTNVGNINSSATIVVPPDTAAVEVEKERPSTFVKIGAIFTAITGFGINAAGLIQSKLEELHAVHIIFLLIGIGIIALAIWFYDRSAQRANKLNQDKMKYAADTSGYNVSLISKHASVEIPRVRELDLDD